MSQQIRMDLFQFINSKDTQDYLRNKNYTFTASEAAYLVYQCKTEPFAKKLTAWQTITEAMPDQALKKRLNMPKIESFHLFLRRYIDLQKCALQMFYEHTNHIYTYEYLTATDGWNEVWELFTDAGASLQHYKKHYFSDSVEAVRIRRRDVLEGTAAASQEDAILTLDREGQVIHLPHLCRSTEDEEFLNIFDRMWFSFPAPFCRGDIVRSACSGSPHVLDYLPTWGEQELQQNGYDVNHWFPKAGIELKRRATDGDCTDMQAYGYGLTDSGLLQEDNFGFAPYLDLEYVREPLVGKDRILYAVSAFLKRKIDLELLLNAAKTIWSGDLYHAQMGEMMMEYTKEGLSLAGLKIDQ